MSALGSSTGLAGIDSSLLSGLHFDTPSPTSPTFPLDTSPYLTMSRAKSNSSRARRSYLSDRSSDYNIGSVLDITNSRTSFAIYQDRDSVKDLWRPPSRNRITRTSTSFHPLPPVLSASTLQLPSLPDFSIHHITLSTSTAALPASPTKAVTAASLGLPPSLPSPSFPPLLSQPILFPEEHKSLNPNTEERYAIPAVQHPNSPYVPWALPVRLQILRPLTPASDRHASAVYPGARTTASGEGNIGHPNDKPKGWKNLRHAVKKNVHHVAKRIVSLKKPSSSSTKPSSASVNSRTGQQSTADRDQSGKFGTVSTYPPLQTRYRASMTSLDSADTATLATWLAARQRLNERYDPDRVITLEDYDLKGSWLNVSRARSPLGNFGPQETDALPGRRPSERRSKTSLIRTTSLTPLNENAVTISFSQLPPRLEFTPISPIAGPGSGSLDILAKIGWEDSMPGGWTFKE